MKGKLEEEEKKIREKKEQVKIEGEIGRRYK